MFGGVFSSEKCGGLGKCFSYARGKNGVGGAKCRAAIWVPPYPQYLVVPCPDPPYVVPPPAVCPAARTTTGCGLDAVAMPGSTLFLWAFEDGNC